LVDGPRPPPFAILNEALDQTIVETDEVFTPGNERSKGRRHVVAGPATMPP
jgi:hypothetical protein